MSTQATETQRPLIYERIAAVIADVKAVGKDHKNQQQNYSFRSIDDFYDACQPALAKHKVFIAPTILEHSREERTTKSGSFMMTTLAKVRFRFFTEDGSSVEADALGEGADSGDKSANKAAAGALKYVLAQVFMIRVEGEQHDSERETPEYAPKGKPAAPAAKNPPAPKPEEKPKPAAGSKPADKPAPAKAAPLGFDKLKSGLELATTMEELQAVAAKIAAEPQKTKDALKPIYIAERKRIQKAAKGEAAEKPADEPQGDEVAV